MAKKILVVDDSAIMRQLISAPIQEAGFDVVSAENGKDALVKMHGTKVDMVVTDLNMPEMDGIELIKNLRAKSEHKFTPIVMITTEFQEAKKKEGREAGASAWIVKPFQSQNLLEVIHKFVK
jgi:two-component system, chemotaxis family, chemotaxis protein CheY